MTTYFSEQAGRSSRTRVPATRSLCNRVVELPSHPSVIVRWLEAGPRPCPHAVGEEHPNMWAPRDRNRGREGDLSRVCHRLLTEYPFKQEVEENLVESQTLFSVLLCFWKTKIHLMVLLLCTFISHFIIFDIALSFFFPQKKKKRFYFLNLAPAQKWKNELQSRASFSGSDVSVESLSWKLYETM